MSRLGLADIPYIDLDISHFRYIGPLYGWPTSSISTRYIAPLDISASPSPDALNATQKNRALYKVWLPTKSKKILKKLPILAVLIKTWSFLEVILDFFRNHTLSRFGAFCVAFSPSGRFFWAIKNSFLTSFLFFHHKGGPLWFRMSKKLTTPLIMAKKWKQKYFW